MKALTIVLFLILSYSYGFCQRQANLSLSNTANMVAGIDLYINQVDKNPTLSSTSLFDNTEFQKYSIYSKKEYAIRNQMSRKVLKIIKINQSVNTSYFKNDHIVYMNEISSVHDNYSSIKNVYFQNDSIIYSATKIYEEQILQIQCSYNGAEQGGSYTLTITKDSIKYWGDRGKIDIINSLSTWSRLKESFSLFDFDKVQTTGFRSYLDGHDLSYVITTDKRTHSFVNAPFNDPQLKKMAEFFKQINLLIPLQKN
ncbi:hypothetical protein [Mucilaginibacter sp. 22184]|uniref:hypothetical protein n=1 Tax=Mucilaginibacter sp. 22184 TaxID=3453887 RepID=UPI003F8706B2